MPVDSDFFDGINPAQWSWYQIQHWLDEKEKYEFMRDVAEHNAMFSNPQAVQQIRDARDNKYETSPEDFGALVEDMFGRQLTDGEGRTLRPNDIVGGDLSSYLNMELDEVKFTPYKDE